MNDMNKGIEKQRDQKANGVGFGGVDNMVEVEVRYYEEMRIRMLNLIKIKIK